MKWHNSISFFNEIKKSGLLKAVGSFFMGIVGWFGMVNKDHSKLVKAEAEVNTLSSDVSLLIKGNMAELHHQLYDSANKYIEQGYITTAQLKDLRIIYNSYHALNGNGTGTALFERCSQLPLKPTDL